MSLHNLFTLMCATVAGWNLLGFVILTAEAAGKEVPYWARAIFRTLRPAIPVLAIAIFVIDCVTSIDPWAWRVINLAGSLATWWLTRHVGDDDDTKKLGKRLTEVVAVAGHRLTVVPAEAGE